MTGPRQQARRNCWPRRSRLVRSWPKPAVEQTWAGLRPGSVDSKPYLGFAPGWTNVVVATGHKRAGIQLAPASAEVSPT